MITDERANELRTSKPKKSYKEKRTNDYGTTKTELRITIDQRTNEQTSDEKNEQTGILKNPYERIVINHERCKWSSKNNIEKRFF